MNKNIFKFLCTSIVMILFFCGCTKSDKEKSTANKSSEEKPIVFNLQKIPESIDTAIGIDASASRVQLASFECLVKYGKKPGEIIPGVAKSWKTSDNGMKYTFTLRDDAKWSNGDPVTAHDFVFGFKRVLEPATASKYAYFFYYITNAKDYNLGKINDYSLVGVEAVNDHTLTFDLCKPCPFFLPLITNNIFAPVNEKFYNTVGEDYALRADKMIYNGPWMITDWVQGGKFVFKKNPYYWNKQFPIVRNMTYLLVPDFNTAANMYRSGELDVTAISGDQLPQFKDKNEVHAVSSGVFYLQLNTQNKFLKNIKIRQAIAMSINRKVLCDFIRKDGATPAYSFVPPGVSNGSGKTFRETHPNKLISYNVEQAKQLFKEGMKEIGYTGTVHLKLLVDQTEDRRRDAQFIQEELHKNLGIDVTLEPSTFQNRLQRTKRKDYDFVYGGWTADYNDPLGYIELWETDGGNNHTSWSNIKYDDFIDKVSNTNDNKARMKDLSQAEKILMKEVPVIPLYFHSDNWLVKTDLKNVILRSVGNSPDFLWTSWK